MQDRWQLDPEHSGSLIRLQNMLSRFQGFHFLLLQHNNPIYRDGLIQFLKLSHPDSSTIDISQNEKFPVFEEQLKEHGKTPLIHLINLESIGSAEQKEFLKGLNYHREYIARVCRGTLVFWLPEHLVRDMALQAMDFWAWREQIIEFNQAAEPKNRTQNSWGTTVSLKSVAKFERIEEIEKFLVIPPSHPTTTNADLKQELSRLYSIIGESEKAKKYLLSAIEDYTELDEALARAVARRDLAELTATAGDNTQALKILKNQVLPVFNSLHVEDEKAVTMGQIADILQARGQLDEALRIRENEELPVYEKLGDVRSKAVTMGKIADILQARGQLDEALRIRENEELPVYEKLGDVRSLLLGRTNLAILLREIDSQAYEERIRELLYLALYDARLLKLPEARQIGGILEQFGVDLPDD